jgi:hypothetical protein
VYCKFTSPISTYSCKGRITKLALPLKATAPKNSAPKKVTKPIKLGNKAEKDVPASLNKA